MQQWRRRAASRGSQDRRMTASATIEAVAAAMTLLQAKAAGRCRWKAIPGTDTVAYPENTSKLKTRSRQPMKIVGTASRVAVAKPKPSSAFGDISVAAAIRAAQLETTKP